jgi:hypothetical protein
MQDSTAHFQLSLIFSVSSVVQFSRGPDLQRLAAGEPGFNVMPPLKPVALIGLPSRAAPRGRRAWKENRSALADSLSVESPALQLPCARREVDQQLGIARSEGHSAAAMFGAFGGVFGDALKSDEPAMRLFESI